MKRGTGRSLQRRIPLLWNKPDGQDNRNNPWGRNNKKIGPPDLEQLFRQWGHKIKQGLLGVAKQSPTGKGPLPVGAALILGSVFLLLFVLSGVYIVEAAERAVITRFGRYTRTVGPGPHWLLPLVESKKIVNIEQVSTSDHNGLVLTKDGNIVSIGVAVQYRIGSKNDYVRSYLFNVVNPIRSLNQSAESALRQVLGQFTMDEVLTQRRAEISTAIKEQIIETLKNYNTGIWVLDVAMQFAKPPEEVRAAFDEVIKAIADEERLVNQAKAYENEVLPKAKGTAERLKNEAMGYKEETILVAQGNAQRFNLVWPQHAKAPKVMQTRLYLETIEQVLSKASKIVIDAGEGSNVIYLPLDRLLNAIPVEDKEKNP